MGDSVGLKRTGDPMREFGRGLLFRFGERTGDSVLIKSASRLVNFFGLLDTTKSAFNRFMCTVGTHKILCQEYNMGGLFSKARATSVLAIDTTNAIKVMNETIVSNSTKTVSSVYNINSAKVINRGVINGNLDVTQTIDLTVEITGQLDSQVLTDLQTKIIDQLNLAADQAAKAQTEFLSFGESRAENITNIKKRLEQAVSDVCEVNNYQQIISTTINVNEKVIENYGVWNGDIVIKQGIVVDILIRNILNSIVNRTNKYLQESGSDIRLSQNAEAANKGLSDIIKNFTDGAKFGSIISAVILCLIIVSLIVVALSPAGQKGLTKASNAAAARYGGVAPSIAAPIAAPVSVPVAPPIAAPVAPPVSVPVAPPVSAPITARLN